jgi:5,10-methenyltetrahydromethanopterin hydrogenase
MKKIACVLFLAILIFISCRSTPSESNNENNNTGDQHIVGGPCSYDEFDGTCEITDVPDDGQIEFTYTGNTRGAELRTIAGNKMEINVIVSDPDEKIDRTTRGEAKALSIKVGNTYVCQISCIKSGTCTPAIFAFRGIPDDVYSVSGSPSDYTQACVE